MTAIMTLQLQRPASQNIKFCHSSWAGSFAPRQTPLSPPEKVRFYSFSTYQVTVLRFYVTGGRAGPQLRGLRGSVPRHTSTASFGRQCSPPDFNHELQRAVSSLQRRTTQTQTHNHYTPSQTHDQKHSHQSWGDHSKCICLQEC